MRLSTLVQFASNKANFSKVQHYIDFCQRYLAFISRGIQAVIVSQNEQQYCFFQYKKDGSYNVTRPINTSLMLDADTADGLTREFLPILRDARSLRTNQAAERALICNAIYTLQQCIGAALDALPAGQSNQARKINGDLFERLIRLLILEVGVDCMSGSVRIPVVVDGYEQFRMNYQHDLIIRGDGVIKVIGSVKTSSKDRLDKIFMDKFLYCKLTDSGVPHVAIFLNDVQRKRTANPRQYGINATFLPGHFRAYTIKLNPLDGVYYCDIRPNMEEDSFLRGQIRTIDHFFCRDLWEFVEGPGVPRAIVSERIPT
ncbi:MAG: hypothetical protein HY718_16670 [Planctomycetes bacterium]|nr:hypothetical protein [Planctomycetota bacterium]